MSKYATFQTTIKDAALLVAALKAMGFKTECHDEPVSLYGFAGDIRPEKGNVIIRRKDTGIGASNDIGFLRQEDGTYRAIISGYDRGAKFNDAWLASLSQNYGVERALAIANQRGHVLVGRETIKTATGQRVQLRFAVR